MKAMTGINVTSEIKEECGRGNEPVFLTEEKKYLKHAFCK